LVRAGFKVELEKPIQVRYEGVIVGDYFADLIVNDELIVEIKATVALVEANEVQMVNYLTATGKDFGLLLNFGGKSLEFRKKFRVCRESPPSSFEFRENSVNSVNSA
jgi:GxxExxY protein